MKSLLFFLMALLSTNPGSAQVLKATSVNLSFFSKAPFEDIYAVSDQGLSAMDMESQTVYFKVLIRSFQFEKALMQEHFNENYLESDQYPYAEFKGKIDNPIDPNFSGTVLVTVSGKLTIHNVTKSYKVPGEISLTSGKMIATAEFPVALADHRIKIPRILIKNIAEVVKISVSATYDTKVDVVEKSTASP